MNPLIFIVLNAFYLTSVIILLLKNGRLVQEIADAHATAKRMLDEQAASFPKEAEKYQREQDRQEIENLRSEIEAMQAARPEQTRDSYLDRSFLEGETSKSYLPLQTIIPVERERNWISELFGD